MKPKKDIRRKPTQDELNQIIDINEILLKMLNTNVKLVLEMVRANVNSGEMRQVHVTMGNLITKLSDKITKLIMEGYILPPELLN